MLDVAKRLVVVEVEDGAETNRREEAIAETGLSGRAKLMSNLGLDIVVCCAVSRPFEAMLSRAGIEVHSGICGDVEKVLTAFASGQEIEQAFLMPGCRARCGRQKENALRRRGRGRAGRNT